jgi:two-component system, chemotaxis family, protein-glutamate methylesterase/glutaminase
MANRDIVVIGASAGGIEVLLQLVKTLPAEFPGSLLIVQHLAPYFKSELDAILNRVGPLRASFPQDGEPLQKGHIYVAPPDHHLLVENDRVHVARGPKENRFRPSIDALFRSAAYNYGARVVGMVLTGALDDGTSGLWSIKRQGGITIVQDPAESFCADMPNNVLNHVEVDHILTVNEMPPLLERLVREPVPDVVRVMDKELTLMAKEVKIAAQSNAFEMGILNFGTPTTFTCPECHGVLVALQEGNDKRFRCHTGHAYSASALLSDVSKKVEEDLWSVVRSLEETVMLLEQRAKHYEAEGRPNEGRQLYQKAHDVRERALHIRKLIFEQEQLSEEAITGNKDQTS